MSRVSSHRVHARLLGLTAVVIGSVALTSAPLALAAEKPASEFNKAGVSHGEECIAVNSAEVPMLSAEGHQLVNAGGNVKSKRGGGLCGGTALQFDGIESVSAGGKESFYMWPGKKAVPNQFEGFVVATELSKHPKMKGTNAGNGAATEDAPGSPAYTVKPTAFSPEQEYEGPSTKEWYPYLPYGLPSGGARYTDLTWSWVNVGKGGTARATVAEGALFYPSNVEPIQLKTYAEEGKRITGSVIARYGRVSTGSGSIYGWMVTSHIFGHLCYNHMVYTGGGTSLSNTLCGSPSAAPVAFQNNGGEMWQYSPLTGAFTSGFGMREATSPSVTILEWGPSLTAFQANTGRFWLYSPVEGGHDEGLSMAAATSPTITTLPGNKVSPYIASFQSSANELWFFVEKESVNEKLGMAPGTSPSISALPSGAGSQYIAAFQSNANALWFFDEKGSFNELLGMDPGSSPSVAGLPSNPASSYIAAFQSNAHELWFFDELGSFNEKLGMAPGTSPSVAGLPGHYIAAFQANTHVLWLFNESGGVNTGLSMREGTSPSVTALEGGGYEVAFQSSSGNLSILSSSGVNTELTLGMLKGTSPAVR